MPRPIRVSERNRSGVGRRCLATTAIAVGLLAAFAPAAAAHDPDDGSSDRAHKREQHIAGASVPVLASPNVRVVANFPDTVGISGVFAKSAPLFIVSSLDSINVYDVSDPLRPALTGSLPLANWENEAINYGERKIGKDRIERFVLVGYDAAGYSPTEPDHVGRAREVAVIDVTDPAHPRIRSFVKTQTSTHTVACVDEWDCRYAYTAGGENGQFSVIDLTDLDNPREAAVLPSPGYGHKWDFDDAGHGFHTGWEGTAAFDVRDPAHPKLVNGTDQAARTGPYNDFIHHNSYRPNADRFTPGAPADVANGNVLLVTEEDFENTDCATAGSFQTWYVPDLASGGNYALSDAGFYRGGAGTIAPLDLINPVDPAEGLTLGDMAFCSAHWFDYHQSGIVVQGYYQGGLRLIDVRDPRDLTEYGHFATGVSEVWATYWVPERNKNGTATQRKTNIVYAVDLIRGLDVLQVDLPGDEPQPVLPVAATVSDADGLTGLVLALASLGTLAARRRSRAARSRFRFIARSA